MEQKFLIALIAMFTKTVQKIDKQKSEILIEYSLATMPPLTFVDPPVSKSPNQVDLAT